MNKYKITGVIILSIILLGISIVFSLAFGAKNIDVLKLENNSFDLLIFKERIPRTVFAIIAGGSLGVSGALMQAVTRNPIADPGILGVNTGASLFVVSGIAFFGINTANEYIWFALFGASITAVFVYFIGSRGMDGATPIKLALSGAAVSAALSSLISAVLLPRTEVLNAYRFWQVGSVGGAEWDGIIKLAPFLIAGFTLAFFTAPSLNAMALGDEMAKNLGVRTNLIRVLAAFGGVLLCGATTALAGPIGFVGLMVPHIVRIFVGGDIRLLILFSAVFGGVLLTLSDVIGRIIQRPSELEAGIVTAFIGAPVLIYIARKARVKTL